MEHSTVMGTEIGINPHGEYILSINGPIDLFDLQVVILEVILGQWSTHTVMGTEIGVNPHGESILSVTGTIDLFDLQVVLKA